MSQNLPAQFVCPSPKVLDFNLKKLHRASVVTRAVARSENPGGLVVMGGDNLPTLVEIG